MKFSASRTTQPRTCDARTWLKDSASATMMDCSRTSLRTSLQRMANAATNSACSAKTTGINWSLWRPNNKFKEWFKLKSALWSNSNYNRLDRITKRKTTRTSQACGPSSKAFTNHKLLSLFKSVSCNSSNSSRRHSSVKASICSSISSRLMIWASHSNRVWGTTQARSCRSPTR